MNTTKEPDTAVSIDRRRLLKLAVASLLVASGCTSVRPESDLDVAMSELNQLLNEMDASDQQRVTAIVQRIRVRAGELADEHRTFTEHFDRLLATYNTSEAQLEQLIGDYSERRRLKRDELLHLQDELHAAMTPEDWSEVVRVLNRAGKSLAGYTLSAS